MTDLYFWAQSLDNQAPDVIFKNEKELSDDKSRQEIILEIYEIPKSNIKVFPTNPAVTIRYSYPKFVIEAIPTQKDDLKRLAPIIIYGMLPKSYSQDWVDCVGSNIQNFVSKIIGRTLDESALEDIKKELSETLTLQKKDGGSEIQLSQSHQDFLGSLNQRFKAGSKQVFSRIKSIGKVVYQKLYKN
jgi:hypothetical protein